MSGKLGSIITNASENKIIYVVPANILYAVLNINIVNTNNVDAKIRIAISNSATFALKDCIEYDSILKPNNILERTGLICSPSEIVSIFSDVAGVVVRVNGLEEVVEDLSALGAISVNQLNAGSNASTATFWRGDGTWATIGEVAGTVGPAGPVGATGPQGPQGPAGTGSNVPPASSTVDGTMSAADKAKLDAITGTNTGDQVIPVWASSATKPSYTGNEISALRTNAVTDVGTAQELRWKKFGANYTIFDASAGTAPDGTAINANNSTGGWGTTYPSLMGWDGALTYGVRVDASRVSDISNTLNANNNYSIYKVLTFAGAGANAYISFSPDANWGVLYRPQQDGSSAAHGFLNAAGGAIFSVTGTGNAVAVGNISAYSDENLKKDWSDLSDNFVEKLAKLKHGSYTRVDTEERQVGVSAQSLKTLLPEAVTDGEYLSVTYGNAAMVSAVELAKEIVLLKEELAKANLIIQKLAAKVLDY